MNKRKTPGIASTKFEAVKQLRLRLKLTQQAFAQQAGLSIHSVSVYETGKTATSDGVLFRLAKLATQFGHHDLAQILTPGQSAETILDFSEIAELLAQVDKAQRTFRQAQEELTAAVRNASRRIADRRRLLGLAVEDDVLWDKDSEGLYAPLDPKKFEGKEK